METPHQISITQDASGTQDPSPLDPRGWSADKFPPFFGGSGKQFQWQAAIMWGKYYREIVIVGILMPFIPFSPIYSHLFPLESPLSPHSYSVFHQISEFSHHEARLVQRQERQWAGSETAAADGFLHLEILLQVEWNMTYLFSNSRILFRYLYVHLWVIILFSFANVRGKSIAIVDHE